MGEIHFQTSISVLLKFKNGYVILGHTGKFMKGTQANWNSIYSETYI